MTAKAPSVFFYVQHLLGIGHLARASRVARAMIARGMDVTLVTGGLPVPGFPGPGIPHIALPPIAVADGAFAGLVTASGEPADEAYLEARKNQLLAAYHAAKPDIVMLEAFPFGRRQVRFELLPLIDAVDATQPRPALVTSLRDILQRRSKPGRDEETVALIRRAFDLVLVHGDPSFAALEDSFALADQITDRIAYSGLVCPPAPPSSEESFDVVVSAGGGAAGKHLIAAAVGAARLLPDLPRWCIITGPNLPQPDYDSLGQNLPSNVTLVRFRSDLTSLMTGARLSVSQAGYNTVADILMAGCHALLVPYAVDGETEQTDRAERLERIGRVGVIAEAALSDVSLATAIRHEIARDLPAQALQISVDGAAQSAEILWALAKAKRQG
ncbi:MAG: glycosyltransferase [Cypionkella sp.]|uniref:glycosyltransferase family protein n=1 Tax=Cypionkella sp. TaxID=2811411 RepID=UPI002ABCC909|nr:glycosyltransferase [Cypionkella sp.]MDZ4310596.1 glycosyltransferase [Cypionkella sp.]